VNAARTFVSRFEDRLNPILVKEVRAALRGKFFRFAFPIVVLGAVLLGLMILIDYRGSDEEMGRRFFGPMYTCLCVALFGIVPFSAFVAMGGEWDENTYDLLVISDMKPRQIVLGKLLSASIEGALYFCAFAPMLVFTFLLRGIDIVSVVMLLFLTILASMGATCIALALSSTTRVRVARVILMAVLAAGAFGLVVFAYAVAEMAVLRPWGGAAGLTSRWLEPLLAGLATIVSVGALAFTIACERLSHPEENHSTGPRVLTTLLLLEILFIVGWIVVKHPSSSKGLHEPLIVALGLASLAQIFFVTESETFTRRVRLHVPRNPVLAFLATPFLPGGGRGVLLFFVHALLVVGAWALMLVLSAAFASKAPELPAEQIWNVIVFALYVFAYLAVTSFLFARRSFDPRTRLIARFVVPTAAMLSMFVPALIGFLVRDRNWMEMQHPMNPFYASAFDSKPERSGGAAMLLVLFALFVLAINAPRISRAIHEVQQASRARRARSRPAAANALVEEARVASRS
jgi:ABC-type transport system involved in multi-copper enzyme maturation permease subunit